MTNEVVVPGILGTDEESCVANPEICPHCHLPRQGAHSCMHSMQAEIEGLRAALRRFLPSNHPAAQPNFMPASTHEPLLQHPSDGWRCVTCGHENPRGALQCQNQECPVLKSSLCTCAPHLDPMGCNNDACPRVIEQRRQRRANEQKSGPST